MRKNCSGRVMSVLLFFSVALAVSTASAKDFPINTLQMDFVSEEPAKILNFNTVCSIGINSRGVLPSPQPLLIVPGTEQFLFPYTRNGVINMNHQQQVEVFCSGSGFSAPFEGAQMLLATCQGGQEFIVNGRRHQFNELRCNEQVEHIARRSRRSIGNICHSSATQIEIGFEVQDRFLWTMEVCHDEFLESTHFSYHKLDPQSNGFQRSIVRPLFTGGIFFGGRNIDVQYTGIRQRQTIAGIIGQEQVDKLWDNDRNFFLARGHLAARADFIFETEQRSTFYLVNAAPQWHSFNAGNWERIEASVKNFLARRNIEADVYTGTFGIHELPDANGVQHPLFLSFHTSGRGRIPVPKFFYKVMIGTRSRRGIAFVGVNNPHATAEDIESGMYHICPDISDQLDWVTWNQANLTMGYSYACDVNELAAVIGHLPASVRTTGLLV